MRQLEVVAVSDDGTHVMLASDGGADRPTHRLRIDDRLVAAVRGELDTSDRRPSELSPKEIQARLRAGDPPDAVAKAARIPVARVLRYAGPVESERARIVEQARAAVMARGRGKVTGRPLGEAVDQRLTTATGFKPETVAWTARRREDGTWTITLTYSARGSRSASWLWQPATQELTAVGLAGSRLAADEPEPRRRRSSGKPAAQPAARARSPRAAGSRRRQSPARSTPARSTPARSTPARSTSRAKPRRAASQPEQVNGAGSASWSDVLFGAATAQQPLTVRRPPPAVGEPGKRTTAGTGRKAAAGTGRKAAAGTGRKAATGTGRKAAAGRARTSTAAARRAAPGRARRGT